MVKESGGTVRVYLDGTSVATGTLGGTTPATRSWYIGDRFDTGYCMDGYMDEIRISNTARYTTTFTPSTTPFIDDANTLLLLHCNGTNGSTTFIDDNGIGRSAKGISANGNAQVDTAQSQFGGASALFDGTGDYLQIPNSSDFNFGSSAFTIEGWVRAANFTGSPSIMGNAEIGTYNGWSLQFGGNGQLYIEFVSSGGTMTLHPSSAFSANTWGHFAFVRSGNSLYIFKDGTLDNTVSVTWAFNNSPSPLIIGKGFGISGTFSANDTALAGHLDEIRISNSARYTTGFTPSASAFVNDANTVLLVHADGTDASTVFTDDNAQLTVTPAATSVNEGSSLTFNVSTIDTSDQTLYYTATNSGDFGTSSGSFSLASNAGSFSVTPTADTTTEGAETFTASVRIGSTSGDIIATTPSVTINDTSVTAATPAVSFDGNGDFYTSAVDFSGGASDAGDLIVASTFFFASNGNSVNDHMFVCKLGTASNDSNRGWSIILQSGNIRFARHHPGGSDTEVLYLDYQGFTQNAYNHFLLYVKPNASNNANDCKAWINGVDRSTSLRTGSAIGGYPLNSNGKTFNWNNTSGSTVKIGAFLSGSGQDSFPDNFEGRIAQFWATGGTLSAPTLSNFYDTGTSKPKDLGTNGTATGLAQPYIYHYGNTSTFPTNNGTGWASYTLTATGNIANEDGPTYA
jgi:hypothetical protein